MPHKKGVKIWIGILILLAVFVSGFWFSPSQVQALGISPPLVSNHQLLRGSHFEATVYISQGAPQEPLKAKLTLAVSDEIKSWINIKPGNEFTIPLIQLFPVTVIVDIPSDAALGNYGGEIKITTQPANLEEGQVTIGIGAAVTLDLWVVEEEIIDFSIIVAKVEPLEEGWPVRVSFLINNKGNTRIKPPKVFLEVFNRLTGEFLWSGETANLNSVESFQTGNSIAEFPVDLKTGSYWAMLQVYKNESEIVEYKIPFDVLARGSLPRPGQFLIYWMIAGVVVLTAGLVLFLWKFSRKNRVFAKKIAKPFKKFKKKFKKVFKILKEK